MTNSRLIFLLGLVLALVVGIFFLQSNNQSVQLSSERQVFPELKNQASLLQRIVINDGKDQIDLEKKNARWVVTTAYDYPADLEALKSLVSALAKAKLVEPKTQKPEFYGRLGVQLPSQDDDQQETSYQITLELANTTTLELIVGKADSAWGGHYVRKPNEAQSWVMDQSLDLEIHPKRWIVSQVHTIAEKDISKVDVRVKGQPEYQLQLNDQKNFQLHAMPGDMNLKYPSILNPLAKGVSPLNIQGVIPRKDLATSKPKAEIAFYSQNGYKVDAKIYQQGDAHYATLEAKIDQLESEPQVIETVEKLNQKTQTWAYLVSTAVYDKFTQPKSSFLEEKVAGQGKQEESAQNS